MQYVIADYCSYPYTTAHVNIENIGVEALVRDWYLCLKINNAQKIIKIGFNDDVLYNLFKSLKTKIFKNMTATKGLE